MVKSPSLEAYYNHVLPKLTEKQAVVLEVLVKYGRMTNKQINHHLGIGINHITPRTGEMCDKGVISRNKEKVPGEKIEQFVYEVIPPKEEKEEWEPSIPRIYTQGRSLSNQTLF